VKCMTRDGVPTSIDFGLREEGQTWQDALGRGVSAISINNAIRLGLAGRRAATSLPLLMNDGIDCKWEQEESRNAAIGLCTLLRLLNPVTLERVLPTSSADDSSPVSGLYPPRSFMP